MRQHTLIGNSRLLTLLAILLTPLLATHAMAANSTEYAAANASLAKAAEDIQALTNAGLPTLRSIDLLEQAQELLRGQVSIEESGGTPDYTRVRALAAEIGDARKELFALGDELTALKGYLDEERATGETNISEAYQLYDQAEQELQRERIDRAKDFIEQSYNKVNELNAAGTKAKAMYDATAATIEGFIKNWWRFILFTTLFVGLGYLLLRREIKKFRIRRTMRKLEKERRILQELIKETQTLYFEQAKISDGEYNVRMNKYAEMIRDINRQIPTLQEELATIKKQF